MMNMDTVTGPNTVQKMALKQSHFHLSAQLAASKPYVA